MHRYRLIAIGVLFVALFAAPLALTKSGLNQHDFWWSFLIAFAWVPGASVADNSTFLLSQREYRLGQQDQKCVERLVTPAKGMDEVLRSVGRKADGFAAMLERFDGLVL
ncbi:hypothetical protein [Deinococcus sp. Arct2-2]|uniref:hypothetical protein n=1 Tax=Deinococcus sp. Arct2-2 TaxID=2568653 RepID=UPI001F0ED5A9|nr:hypothetical protein [Deinococcus sp. Arct2-2]